MQDAHLHLQDDRFQDIDQIIAEMRTVGVIRCVVNGTHPDDWERVKTISEMHPDLIIPSYGLHPWKTPCHQDWKPLLKNYLSKSKIPCIGECGLDRWMPDFDIQAQEDAFNFQLDLASEMNAPISIHILKAWGWFMEVLRARKANLNTKNTPLPERGFLLHSYNGSADLIPELTEAGAHFSFSGYYLSNIKKKQLQIFLRVPKERLLIESDAPDMLPPKEYITHPLPSSSSQKPSGKEPNHPANIKAILKGLTSKLAADPGELSDQISENFSRFFLSKSPQNR